MDKSIVKKAMDEALAGGIPGMAAMSVQVVSLMWLRTTVNYQYRYGTNTMTAMRTLYRDGGIRRFYKGLGPALIQGPLSRFGDTAANAGTLSLLESYDIPIWMKTAAASMAAASFRIFLMPIDTLKTTLQVEGNNAVDTLKTRMNKQGIRALYHGSLAASTATFAGHYPWFTTYNYLNLHLPEYNDTLSKKLVRSAFIGFCASLVSDCCANSFRVVKTTRQTSKESLGYISIVQMILKKDGVMGLLGRGLATKITTNGLQGLVFSVAWKLAQEQYKAQKKS
jgi:hypothetical protein